MKKSLILAGALVSAIALAPIAGVSAATTTSHGHVEFKTNNGTTTPGNPSNPGTTTTPGHGGSGTPGPLSIDYVPDLVFGAQDIQSTDQTYKAVQSDVLNANGDPVYTNSFAQVTDNRGLAAAAPDAGWNLTVTQTAQFNNGTEDLAGASLAFKGGSFVPYTAGASVAGYTATDATLVPGTASEVISADTSASGTIMGIWNNGAASAETPITAANNVYVDTTAGAALKTGADLATAYAAAPKDEGITLSVPGASHKTAGVDYTTELTWTLSATPHN